MVIGDEGFKRGALSLNMGPRYASSQVVDRVRLKVESEDDLWVLSQVCSKGCLVGMLSHRRDSTTGTMEDFVKQR